jgi:ATPase family associated with various cellular activities (AAA)
MQKYFEGLANIIYHRASALYKAEEVETYVLDGLFNFLEDDNALAEDLDFYYLTKDLDLAWEDKLLIILSVAPCLRPQVLDPLKLKPIDGDARHTIVGGYVDASCIAFLPTLDTLIFLLAGSDINLRAQYLIHFSNNHVLFKNGFISIHRNSNLMPYTSAVLKASEDIIHLLLTGEDYSPEFSTEFPAKKITTLQTWDDLVLDERTLAEVVEIKTWIEQHEKLHTVWGMGTKLKPGYRSLFYGPSGTGKTFTAALLGKYTGKEVFRVDLSLVVSKFIGETEKNLAKIFDRAEKKNWILFFDEADALFGKRTNVSSSHDRYANQEVSFLLQRVEDFAGVVILATNLKANIDDAFARRFQSMIQYALPNAAQRLKLWQNNFPTVCTLEDAIDMEKIAARYELSGGSIINVVQYCCLRSLENNSTTILLKDIETGIRRELHKEGKSM